MQVFIVIFSIISTALLMKTLVISANVFLLSNSTYKDFINIFDNAEFKQLTLHGVAIESAYVQHTECFKHYNNMLKKYYNNLKRLKDTLLSDEIIDKEFFKPVVDYDNSQIEKVNKIVYFSPNENFIKSDSVNLSISVMKNMYFMINEYSNVKCFINNFIKNDNPSFQKVIIIDYEIDLIYLFPYKPDDDSLIKDIKLKYKQNYLKNFLMKEEKTIIDNTFYMKKLIKPMTINVDNLPFYKESMTPTDLPFNYFAMSGINSKNYTPTEDKFNSYNITQSFILLSNYTLADTVFDPISLKIDGIKLIVTDYFNPYKVYSPFQCKYLNKKIYSKETKNKKIANLEDCLTLDIKEDIIDDQTIKNKFYDKFNLYKSDNLGDDVQELMREYSSFLIYNKTDKLIEIQKIRIDINDHSYKINKHLMPITGKNMIDFYYPVSNLYNVFILKSEGYFKNNKTIIFVRAVANFFYSLSLSVFISYLIMIYTVYNLIKITQQINRPMELISKLVENVSNKEEFNIAKKKLEEYSSNNDDNNLKEFSELIRVILDLVDGNIDLKESITIMNKIKNALERDEQYKDFEMIKINNILVFEDKILQKEERKNSFKDVLDKKLEDIIKHDEVIQNNEIFKEIHNKLNFPHAKKSQILNSSYDNHEENFIVKFPNLPFSNYELKKKNTINNLDIDSNIDDKDDYDNDEDLFNLRYITEYNVKDDEIKMLLNDESNPLYTIYQKEFEKKN